MRNGKEMLRVSRVYFYQHEDDLYGVNERKGENGKRKTGLSHTESTENTEFHCFILIPTERLDS